MAPKAPTAASNGKRKASLGEKTSDKRFKKVKIAPAKKRPTREEKDTESDSSSDSDVEDGGAALASRPKSEATESKAHGAGPGKAADDRGSLNLQACCPAFI